MSALGRFPTRAAAEKAHALWEAKHGKLQIIEHAGMFAFLPEGEKQQNQADTTSYNACTKSIPFAALDAEDFATSGDDVEWMIESILPRAELAVIYGASGSGKTFLALDMAGALARGVPFGPFKVTRPCRVGYICAEGRMGFKKRLRAYAKHHKVPLRGLLKVIADVPDFLNDTAAAPAIAINLGPCDVIIVDTLSRSHSGNENSGEDMGTVLRQCQLLHEKTGALVILIHHTGKDEARGQRGWSGIKAACDTEIEVTRDGDTEVRHWSVSKQKDGEELGPFGIRLKVVELEKTTSCWVAHVDPIKAEKRGAKLRAHAQLALDVLLTVAPEAPIDSAVYQMKVAEAMPRGNSKRDLRQQHAKRAIDSLVGEYKKAFVSDGGTKIWHQRLRVDKSPWD